MLEAGFRSRPLQELCFGIVGLGLIGGSYAKALRSLKVCKIIGIERCQATAAEALRQRLVDIVLPEPGEALREADVVICAIYPEAVLGFVAASVEYFKDDVLLTDVSGIKNSLITDVQGLLKPGMEFISGHPMAGREGSGLGMSDAAIFRKANYIIVPEKHNTPEAVEWLDAFARTLGCTHTVTVTPQEHDRTIAYTSNLPHISAISLMNSSSYNDKTKYFVAGSFRDGTRVADINPELWSNLFLANKDRVADEVDKFIEQLSLWRDALKAGDAETLKALMRKSGARRRELFK